jgi:hypothetical protein
LGPLQGTEVVLKHQVKPSSSDFKSTTNSAPIQQEQPYPKLTTLTSQQLNETSKGTVDLTRTFE